MKKYEFMFEKRDENEQARGRIVELGDENDNVVPVITPYTYSFKIFNSERSIEELQKPFELPEYCSAKTYYFGKLYTVEDYIKRFPNNYLDELYTNYSESFRVIQASPAGIPFAFPKPVLVDDDFEVIDSKLVHKFIISTSREIAESHNSLFAF